jgi:hypothetical protein
MMTVLSHEINWIRWKEDSCKSYELPSCNQLGVKRRRFADDSLATNNVFLGNDEMTRLWKNGIDIESELERNHKK